MSFEVLTIYAVVIVNLVIGVRLIRKGFKDSAKPELILGWALSCDGAEWFLWYLSAYTPADGTPLGDAFGFLCRVFIAATVCCLLWFTQAVFHAESRLARSVVILGWLGMFGALAGTAWERDWHGYGAESAWIWVEQITQNCVYAWMLVETGRYYLSFWASSVGQKDYDLLDRCTMLDVETTDFYGSGRGIEGRWGVLFFPCSWRMERP